MIPALAAIVALLLLFRRRLEEDRSGEGAAA